MNKMFFRKFLLLFIFILLLTNVFAILNSGEIKIFAVTDKEVGMVANLKLYLIPGNGEVSFITSNSLVGKDTQTTGNIALEIAKKKTGVSTKNNTFIFDIKANASEVEGPSAGAAMTLLTYSILSEKKLNSDVGITGTINTDGSVGVVGGVYPKSKAAAKDGLKLFMIPKGEARQVIKENGKVESINLLSYGPEKLGLKIVEVSNIDEVIEYAYSDIGLIEVDESKIVNGFIPPTIEYNSILIPMQKMSESYIERANGVISEAKKELETTSLDERMRSKFYPQLGVTERNSEMALIYLDHNYLYSSANFAFNSRILAGTIKEIAANPSLISKNSTILGNKIQSLKREINLLKDSMDFISLDSYEWVIGAQQRIAYAENALKNLEENSEFIESLESIDEIEGALFNRVYEYVSAQAWIDAAKDFMVEAKKSKQKVIPMYSETFIQNTLDKIEDVEKLISDSNASQSALSESLRRLNSAKISYDNNFYFAAMYDAYFSEAFIIGEQEREFFDDQEIFNVVETELSTEREQLISLWALLFFDHAHFFLENAKYEMSIGRINISRTSLDTSYDLIVLAKNIGVVREEVESYLTTNNFSDYYEKPDFETTMDISYTKRTDMLQVVSVLFVFVIIIFFGILLFFSFKKSHLGVRGPINIRISKLQRVISNLDNALTKKKISDDEYFFLKKRYDDELDLLRQKQHKISEVTINLDESRAKIRALENGLKSLQKHYKSGLIIDEDYKKHYLDITKEIADLKSNIYGCESEFHNSINFRNNNCKLKVPSFVSIKDHVTVLSKQDDLTKKSKNSFENKKIYRNRLKSKKFLSNIIKGTPMAEDGVKGSAELAKEQLENEKLDKIKRKKALKKYSGSKKNSIS
jgi:uncharacterized protein